MKAGAGPEFPVFRVKASLGQNLAIGAVFTVVSLCVVSAKLYPAAGVRRAAEVSVAVSEPAHPRALRDPGEQARRRAMLGLQHVAALASFVQRLRARTAAACRISTRSRAALPHEPCS
jgi:hypothetical protein